MNRLAPGEEPIVVLVGEAGDGSTDLFAVSAGGGTVYQLTYNRPVESRPALSPDGAMVAFLRRPLHDDGSGAEVTVMNLINAAERQLPLPDEAGAPVAVAWTRDGTGLVVRASSGTWRLGAPPADPEPRVLEGDEAALADSLLGIVLGSPAFAMVEPCAEGGFCVRTTEGEVGALTATGRDPFRWGPDSVAWFDGERIEVRPLGPGRSRHVIWSQPPRRPREATYARPTGPPPPRETGLVPPRGAARQ